MKPASTKQTPGHHRCLYLSATGRQCRNWAQDPRAMFCHRHFEAQPHGPDDFALHLLNRACGFQNAHGIHDSIRRLYSLLASGAISPRRAAVLGYLTSLMLRTLPAVYEDPFPEAGTPMSAVQLAEREKAKSVAASPLTAAASPQKPALAEKAASAPKSVSAQSPLPEKKNSAQHPSPTSASQPPSSVDPALPTTAASTRMYLGNGTGRPMPATPAEFAANVPAKVHADVPKYLASTPSTTKVPNLSTTTITISPTDKEQSSTFEPRPETSPGKADDESTSGPSSAPINQSTNKKSYQVRLPTNINWPITGSPPPWGWTTDPQHF